MTSQEAMEIVIQKKNELADAIEGLTDALHFEHKLDDALEISYNLMDIDIQITNRDDFDFFVGVIEDLTDEVFDDANKDFYGGEED